MNKQELIQCIAAKAGANKLDTLRFVDAFEEVIKEALVNGQEVPLAKTGKFKVKEMPAKVGRNPKTGEPVQVPAKRKAVFLPAKGLKDALTENALA